MKDLENLKPQAIEAASHFSLPLDWQKDRTERQGITLDPPGTIIAEDAVGFDYAKYTLDVSVLDTSFVRDGSIAQYARQFGDSFYRSTPDGVEAMPMLPIDVANNGLNFVDGQKAPAITVHIPFLGAADNINISKTVFDCKRVDDPASGLPESYSDPTTRLLCDIKAAISLKENPWHNQYLGDSEEAGPDELYQWAGRHLVRMCMDIANKAVAEFMTANQIPAIYFNIDNHSSERHYSTNAENGGFQSYARVTSPMRRLQDFVNIANASAFLEDREYSYPTDDLEDIVKDYNHRNRLRIPGLEPYSCSTSYLSKMLSVEKVATRHVARAIFDMHGDEDSVAEVQRMAIERLKNNPAVAHNLVDCAVGRGYLIKRPATPEDNVTAEAVIEIASETSHDSRSFAYPSGHRWFKEMQTVRLMGQICGIATSPELSSTDRQLYDKIVGPDSHKFLEGLAKAGRDQNSRLNMYAAKEDEGKFAMMFYLRGENHRYEIDEPDPVIALRKMCSQFISKVGLLENMPGRMQINHNPLSSLEEWRRYSGAKPVQFDTNRENDQVVSCKAALQTNEGEVYEVTGIGNDRRIAIRSAAAFLLSKLPEGPYPVSI